MFQYQSTDSFSSRMKWSSDHKIVVAVGIDVDGTNGLTEFRSKLKREKNQYLMCDDFLTMFFRGTLGCSTFFSYDDVLEYFVNFNFETMFDLRMKTNLAR
jgi:hypothetical protein